MASLDVHFGTLRAHLHSSSDMGDLVALCEQANALNREKYRQVWLPYLRSFSLPVHRVTTVHAVESHFYLFADDDGLAIPVELDGRKSKPSDTELQSLHDEQWSLLDGLYLNGRSIRAEALRILTSKDMPALRTLDLCDMNLTGSGIATLSALDGLGGVTSLRLQVNQLKHADVRQLVNAPCCQSIELLNLAYNKIGERGCQALIEMPWFATLMCLDLAKNDLNDQSLEHLARAPSSSLEELQLYDNSITAEGVRHLIDTPIGANLKSLTLAYNRIGDAGVEYIVSGLSSLESLNVYGTYAGMDGIRALVRATDLNLHTLIYGVHNIEDDVILELVKWPNLNGLRHLSLWANHLTAEAMRALFHGPNPCELKTFNISNNKIGDRGVEYIVGASTVANMNSLRLANNGITADGVRHLIASPYLAEVKSLELYGNALGDEGIELLSQATNMPQLTSLYVGSTSSSYDARQRLGQSNHFAHNVTIY